MNTSNAGTKKLNLVVTEKTDGVFRSFRELYTSYNDYIRNVIFRLGVKIDLEDAVQVTFIKAWQNLTSFKKKSQFKTWLTKIAINTSYEYLRKQKPVSSLKFTDTSESISQEDLGTKQAVDIALNRLSLEHRLVIVLCVVEEYSQLEVSSILQVPIGTVKSRLNRAREALKHSLIELGVYYDK